MRGMSEPDAPGNAEEGRLRVIFSRIGFYRCPEITFWGDIETAFNVDHTESLSNDTIRISVPKIAAAEGDVRFEVFQRFIPEDFGDAQISDVGPMSLPVIADSHGIPDPDGPVGMETNPHPHTIEIHQTTISRKELTTKR